MPHRVNTITLLLQLAMCIQYIKGIERMIDSEFAIDGDVPISNDEDIPATNVIGNGSRSHAFKGLLILCCIFGNCSCPSLYTVLANLTSNTLINITTDVELSSVIPLADLANITITGHNSPTVHCNNSGGLHFVSCHNCTIQGITWDRCGTRDNANVSQPVLQLSNCSEMIIKICSFQHSIGQAIVLSQMTGDVNISHCNFSSNNQYEGHGSAIHYSSHGRSMSSLTFMIGSSNFIHNEGAKSVVYFDRSSMSAKSCEYLYLQNLNFYYNKEVPIYLSNQNLYISGNIEFIGNVAENGGGIYISDHSNVTFCNSATVKFTHNRANRNGGAIFLTNHSSIVFKVHHILQQCYDDKFYNIVEDQYLKRSLVIAFCNNAAIDFGENIYAHNSIAVFGDTADAKFDDYLCHNLPYISSRSEKSKVHISSQSIMIFGGNSRVAFRNFYLLNGDVKVVILINSTISFEENSTVNFTDNNAVGAGGVMYIDHYSTITFEGNSTVRFTDNSAGSYSGVRKTTFEKSSIVTFIENSVDGNGGVMYIVASSTIAFEGSSTVYFTDNGAIGNGGVMYIDHNSTITFAGNSTVRFTDNSAGSYGGVMYIDRFSTIAFEGSSTVTFIHNSADNNGGVMYIDDFSTIAFEGSSTVTFIHNSADSNGGVMYIVNSTIIIMGDCNVNFINNHANSNVAVMYIDDFSTIAFEGSSAVNCNSNGGVMYIDNYSTITFEGNSTVDFTNNSAYGNGGVMYIDYNSTVAFEGSSTVNFIQNGANANGGVMYIVDSSTTAFEGSSTINFIHNGAVGNGGVMYIDDSSNIAFEGSSTVNFTYNGAHGNGGVIYIVYYSTITFKVSSTVNFTDNGAYSNGYGGVMYIDYSTIIFEGNSAVNFIHNSVNGNSGVMYIVNSIIIIMGDCNVNFINNHANSNGGVMYIDNSSTIAFEGSSTVNFIHNSVNGNGGVMYVNSTIIIMGDCNVNFINNHANSNGGVMYIVAASTIAFKENCTVNFSDNSADGNGGVMYTDNFSTITFEENSIVNFIDNEAFYNGGVIYVDDSSTVTFKGNSTVNFLNNTADNNGGVMYTTDYSNITFRENSTATFHHNHASGNGGVMYIYRNSSLWLKERAEVIFSGNTAYLGGSVYMKFSYFVIVRNSSVVFINNTAVQDGGAIYLRGQSEFELLQHSNVSFNDNSASDYGGAIYVLYDKWTSINFYDHTAYFKGNTAGTTQNSVYINVNKSCDRDCFLNSIAKKNDIPITTSPNRLVLYNPTKFINGNETDCDTYYMTNIMLGQDITFDACLLDYYDQPTKAASEFLITGMNHQDYNISGSKYISILCNHTTQGIAVTGNLQSNKTYNYSMNISLYVTRASESKVVSVNLFVEISQCHPGFWYSQANESRRCECYNTGNIISCSGSNSTIKRGYWYGSVTGTPTIATCPNDYCNFTCCEITNGIYHLSPVRTNQCRPHRSGTACGSCEEGYTLSFDSPECVEVKRCTVGLILVTTLSLLYWIAVAIAVFVIMYFKVSFGSLYAIVYYYSILDILLSRVLFISNGLYTSVAIISSLAKLTPQFLGQLCLIRNMSGIDQQFIHYAHPVVVFLILVMISILARRSRKVSSFVSKGIISFICFLLLLSYASVASTSLLLMRPLTFEGIDKVYTYLSPDIEYFHGRHLVYAIVALIFTITIVIGFPVLLLLEPFLNSKINFIKIKPLLDQFQGCYKDKYRYFASYYMICRLVIIILVIIKISDDFTTQYLLILSCALMQLIHVLVRPYASTIHNIFDGIILQLIVIISVLPIIEFVDQYDKDFVIVIIYVLVILPLISFIAIKVWINKDIIQIASFKCKHIFISCYYNEVATDDPQEPVEIKEFGVIVDENMRRNAIIVDV